MELKYILLLMPLTWAIIIGIFANGINSLLILSAITLVSFMVSAISVITLSSFKILDSGLGEGANKMLFIIIFAGLFYGVSVAQLYLGASTSVTQRDNILVFDNIYAWMDSGYTVDTLPDYVHHVIIAPSAINPIILYNTNYNSTAIIPEGTSISGFATDSSGGYGNEMFTDMPYFDVITVIFGVMYVFGIYFNVSGS